MAVADAGCSGWVWNRAPLLSSTPREPLSTTAGGASPKRASGSRVVRSRRPVATSSGMPRLASSSTAEFFVSGRDLPWWLAGTSMVATSFSVDTPLLITGFVRRGGIQGNWIWWCFAIGGVLSAFVFAPYLIHEHEQLSAPTAMMMSFKACFKNIASGLVFFLVMIPLSIGATIPFGLGWLVLMPVSYLAFYTAYRDIFIAQSTED